MNSSIGEEDLGEVEFSEGIGGQLNHARNDLDALIVNVEQKGDLSLKDDSKKIDNTTIVFVIIGSLVVSYLLAHLITSNDENKILMNNIKTGEPPF